MKKITFKKNENKEFNYEIKLSGNDKLICSLDYQTEKPVLSLNKNIDKKLSRWIKELCVNIIIAHKNFEMVSAVYSFRMQDEELAKLLKPRIDRTTHPVIENAYYLTLRKMLNRDFIKKEFNNFMLINKSANIDKMKALKKLAIEIGESKKIPDEIILEAFILYNCLNHDGSFKEESSIFNETNEFIFKEVI